MIRLDRRIRVNSVRPGTTCPPMTEPVGVRVGEGTYPNAPMGRLGVTAEIAGAAGHLRSGDAAYTPAAEIAVEGGRTAGPMIKYAMGQ